MGAIDYLHSHGLEAETLIGGQVAIWPEEAITPQIEAWIVQNKIDLIKELRLAQKVTLIPWSLYCDGQPFATMLSPCQTRAEALESARMRWRGKNLTVEPWPIARRPRPA